MREFDVNIIIDKGKGKDFSKIEQGDVVIFPAFGATVQELQVWLTPSPRLGIVEVREVPRFRQSCSCGLHLARHRGKD